MAEMLDIHITNNKSSTLFNTYLSWSETRVMKI